MIPKGLKYVCDDDEGIYRKGRGKGFIYLNKKNEKIEDEKILARINDLVIPPNWKNVWICKDPNGYLQVTGYDQKGRKQYLYHKKYTSYRQKGKFKLLYKFGLNLPIIRSRIQRDLKKKGWPKEKLLALIIRTLDDYHLRIGSTQYLHENETYGITTLRRKHIRNENGELIIEYKGKSGKLREIHVNNPVLINLIKETSELPGFEVFRYIDEDGKSRKIHSQEVNEYLQEITQMNFTAKDFRTWGGTVTVVEVCKEAKAEIEENPRKKLDTAIVKKVAERLGNTISTCREYYIHPKVLKMAIKKDTEIIPDHLPEDIKYGHLLRKNEKKVLSILNESRK
jgi:DNA topoisomerase-1